MKKKRSYQVNTNKTQDVLSKSQKQLIIRERPKKQRSRQAFNTSTRLLEDLPVTVGNEYEADIIGIGHDGEGVGRVEGYTLFVPGTLPGERVLVRIEHVKKQYGYAKLLQVLVASPDRVAPPCGIYEQCGGCQLQHLDYASQLRVKRQLVM